MTRKIDALSPRHRLFVMEYLKDRNGAAAYRRAGYQPGSPRAAEAHASRLVSSGKVAAAIAEESADIAERMKVSVDEVVGGLRKEATFDGEGSSHAARVSAWKALGAHLGMFVQRHEVTNKNVPLVAVLEVRLGAVAVHTTIALPEPEPEPAALPAPHRVDGPG
jgi:hypothetical protein